MAKKKNDTDKTFEKVLNLMADRLKELRIESGYTSYENFAWDNGINRMQYWKMEKGSTNFTMKSLYRVLQVHKMSFGEFFEGLEKK
ncbi:helix-turn-helix transcriptional regulator [uncultured Psychroserpens sp.]|uniref:helix-turn-helix domain-containing protein n=1 Tax=uncultured Psychroserpens sp. TaxID=255436 RepID=UPI0026184066|nr:helix-turn-helix transcriptional regulator [uncultured Psychroserpens sp.]